ncbi:DNA-3-methyladenine glycosylase I [Thermodesulfobacteriota bacterium]
MSQKEAQKRCIWPLADPLLIEYHDTEWGVPLHDDRKLFEFLVLDAAQAGLSWITILRKRQNYRKAFDGFDPSKIAGYGTKKIQKLLQNDGIIRNKMKIASSIENARVFLEVQEEMGSFDAYIWQFVGGKPIKNAWKHEKEIPTETKESLLMSKDLKKRGFKFVGPIICYAFMQAAGMVNDHLVDCFRYHEV